jgi:predicted enzyme related to lactoylglutathione lyase
MPWSHGKFYWNELMTRNVETAKKFYTDTLGWEFDDMDSPGETYWLAFLSGETVAGLYDISGAEFQGVPEGWMPYIAVDNVDQRVAKAVQAGAKVMKPAFDVPDVGRIAILQQPGGAAIGWMTPSEQQ